MTENENYSTTYDMWLNEEEMQRITKAFHEQHMSHFVIIAKAKTVGLFINGDQVVEKDK